MNGSLSDISFTFSVIVTIYTIVISILLISKDLVNKSLFKHFTIFNIVLFFFLSGLIIHFCYFIFFDFSDLNNLAGSFKNALLSKLYLVSFMMMFIVLSVYFCRNIYNAKIYIRPGKNLISLILFIYIIVCGIVALVLPVNINVIHGNIYNSGPAYIFVNVASTLPFLILTYYAFKYIKNIDPLKNIGPLFILLSFGLSNLVKYFTGYNLYEIFIAISLVIVYLTLEKKEEKLQRDIVSATLDLERATRFKSDFLSNMSHELKTPLNSILAVSKSLYENKNANDGVKNDIDAIVYSADSLNELIINILTLGKYEQRKLTVNDIVYNVFDEINSLTFIEKNSISKINANFTVEIDDNVPKQLIGSKDYLKIIINNTLNYASTFVKGGTLGLKITWKEIDSSHGKLVINITNYEEDVVNIYSRVESLLVDIYDNDNDLLSISIANKLCEELNGEVNYSHLKDRCTISYIIPQKINVDDMDIQKITYNGKKALVVDDAELNLKVANRVLTSVNFEVELVHSGMEAIDCVERKEYDIIFLDIMMPTMNGEETLKKLKEISGFKTPVIALTADEVSDARIKYEELGFDGYIVKPFTKTDLINEIKNIVRGDE